MQRTYPNLAFNRFNSYFSSLSPSFAFGSFIFLEPPWLCPAKRSTSITMHWTLTFLSPQLIAFRYNIHAPRSRVFSSVISALEDGSIKSGDVSEIRHGWLSRVHIEHATQVRSIDSIWLSCSKSNALINCSWEILSKQHFGTKQNYRRPDPRCQHQTFKFRPLPHKAASCAHRMHSNGISMQSPNADKNNK